MSNMNAWQAQRTLMEISGQKQAPYPELNNTSILYAALILEEVSELLTGLRKITDEIEACSDDKMVELNNIFNRAEKQCHEASTDIRAELKKLGEFDYPITDEEAVELADASTDIAVVNCGFSIATGFDGQACYDDTVGSNLSKANPDTGVIDKTPDGKWIKGRNYREPNLHKVIFGGD